MLGLYRVTVRMDELLSDSFFHFKAESLDHAREQAESCGRVISIRELRQETPKSTVERRKNFRHFWKRAIGAQTLVMEKFGEGVMFDPMRGKLLLVGTSHVAKKYDGSDV